MKPRAKRKPVECVRHKSFIISNTELIRLNEMRTKYGQPLINKAHAERELGAKSEPVLAAIMERIGDPERKQTCVETNQSKVDPRQAD